MERWAVVIEHGTLCFILIREYSQPICLRGSKVDAGLIRRDHRL